MERSINVSLPPGDERGDISSDEQSLEAIEALVMAEIEAELTSIEDPTERQKRAQEIQTRIEAQHKPY